MRYKLHRRFKERKVRVHHQEITLIINNNKIIINNKFFNKCKNQGNRIKSFKSKGKVEVKRQPFHSQQHFQMGLEISKYQQISINR